MAGFFFEFEAVRTESRDHDAPRRIVMPSLSISFGTLVATTVNTLRQRQLDLRVLLNQELSAVQLLRVGLDANFRGATTMNAREADARAALLLEGYVARVIQESSGRSFDAVSVFPRVYGSPLISAPPPRRRRERCDAVDAPLNAGHVRLDRRADELCDRCGWPGRA